MSVATAIDRGDVERIVRSILHQQFAGNGKASAVSHRPNLVVNISAGKGGGSPLGLLADLARALKVTPEWLCFGVGPGPTE